MVPALKRPAEESLENAEKKAATAVADERVSGEWITHDNGGRPFLVDVDWSDGAKATVKVFKQVQNDDDDDDDNDDDDDDDNEEAINYEDNDCISFSAERVFVGRCPEKGPEADGNSILLQVEGLKYVFIGDTIFSFTAKSRITKYVSIVGNNDVPYPWAMDEEGSRYLMIESCILSSKLFESGEGLDNPYDVYYEAMLITPDISCPEPKPLATQFQGITEFYIGEDPYTMRHSSDPAETYDRLADLGEFAVVKEGKRVKISKEDFVKLIGDFADERGIQKLNEEELVERQI
mmetsp:Transcript_3604/g.6404  ORF Transcript_3604/g.6404 Transcript_3604/m.6404 type:complete len:292 (+) Transcript_3604:98-973(+)